MKQKAQTKPKIANFPKIGRKFINFAKIGEIHKSPRNRVTFKNFAEIWGICNIHHWLWGWTPLHLLSLYCLPLIPILLLFIYKEYLERPHRSYGTKQPNSSIDVIVM